MTKIVKKLILSVFLITFCRSALAGVIYNTDLTGADLSGLQVTANFINGASETLLWQTFFTNLGDSGNDIADHEGFSGGVIGGGWGLSQQGYTLGDFDGQNIFGAWSFFDQTNSVSSFVLDVVDTGLVFDTVFLSSLSDDINGSAQGRPFFAFHNNQLFSGANAQYTNAIDNELFKTTTISLTDIGAEFSFWLDLDKAIDVPEPPVVFIFISALVYLVRKKIISITSFNNNKKGHLHVK